MAGRAPRPHDVTGPTGADARFAIVAARFNERITKRLRDRRPAGASRPAACPTSAVEVHWVPGSFELPQAAAAPGARPAATPAIVCVGCVIRGETPHFEHVARRGGGRHPARRPRRPACPTTFGVITALTEEQAWARAGGAVGNRGQEAAEAALEMADVRPPGTARRRRAATRDRRDVELRGAGGK